MTPREDDVRADDVRAGDGRAGGGTRTELRLALVCYGGVSLAVYMHGVTKELHRLVRASRRFDELTDLDDPNPFAPERTEWAYVEALRAAARRGRRLSVSIDVVAGTSAGGINGVVLAKCLALDADPEALRELWIEEGDLRSLLRGVPFGGLRLRAVTAALALAGGLRRATSPLRGERMSRLLLEAFRAVDRTARGTLLPPAGTLDLLVTLTDLHGFEVLVPTGAGGASQRDRAHAQVLQFRAHRGDLSAFGPDATPDLAFAARATASFPGAFAPVGVASFAQECGARLDAEQLGRRFRWPYEEHGVRAADAWFVDGGVLDNAPFDLVVEAVAAKRAQSEVVRRLVYVQPDPGRPLVPAPPRQGGTPAPGWLAGVWRAVGGVRGSHGVLRDLLALRDLNTRIAQVGAVAASSMTAVLSEVDAAVGSGAWAVDGHAAVQRVSDEMHRSARRQLGAGFPTYCRLKVEAAARRLADEVAARLVFPPDSSRTSTVRAVLGAWARASDVWADPDPSRLLALLGPVDVPYRERRLLFLLAGLNELYPSAGTGPGAPARADLDALKARAWDLLEDLRRVPGEVAAALPAELVAFLSAESVDAARLTDPGAFAREHADDLARLVSHYREALATALGDGSTPLWEAFAARSRGWDDAHRRRLLARYLGFPLWDGLIFPTVALSELPQFSPIGVAQWSPLAAAALPVPEGGKLKGIPLHHFAAFVSAEWRENDYLWGRLDGVELVLRTLLDAADPHAPAASGPPATQEDAVATAGGATLQAGLRAVLAEETGLRRVAATRAEVAAAVEALPLPRTVDVRDVPSQVDLRSPTGGARERAT